MTTERRQTAALLGTALCIYAPFIFLGYGANSDSVRIAETGRMWIATGVYTPSRYPGFPVHEIPAAVLAHLGGSALSNAGTAAMAILGAYAFTRLLAHYAVPHRTLLTLALIANPVYWTTATYTIDYVWSLSLLLVGFGLMRHGYCFWSCVVLGLATGSRATSIGFAMALVGYQFVSQRADRVRLALYAPLIAVMGALAYAPTLRRDGLLRLYFGDWNSLDYFANVVYGNLMFVGPQAMVGLLLVVVAFCRSRTKDVSTEWQLLAALCIVGIVGYEVLFLIAPLQVGYLLPALPFLLMLLGIVLRHRPRLLLLWVALSASSAVLSVNVVSVTGNVHRVDSALPPLIAWPGPSVRGRSSVITGGLFVHWGYVVSDAAARWNAGGRAFPVNSASTRRE